MPQPMAFQKRGAPPAPPVPVAPMAPEPDGDESAAAASDGVMVTCPGCGETFDAIQHLAGAPAAAAGPMPDGSA